MSNLGFRINEPDAIYQQFDDEVVALNLATGAYHSLPGVAGQAFLCLTPDGATIQGIASQLASRYEAELPVIEKDLGLLFARLEQASLVIPAVLNGGSALAQESRASGSRAAYRPPELQSHNDLQELFLIDPIHDVSAAGWPNVQAGQENAAEAVELTQEQFQIAGQHVIFEKMGDETVVMNLTRDCYFSISGTAEDVFSLLEQEPTFEELQSALGAKYSVEAPELKAALQVFLAQLAGSGLIVHERKDPPGTSRKLALGGMETTVPFAPMSLVSFQDAGAGNQTVAVRFRVRRNDLLIGAAGGEMVLADRETGDYYGLNEPAADVFSLLSNHSLGVQQIVTALSPKYATPERQLAGAVVLLLRKLAAVHLVVVEPIEAPGSVDAPSLPTPARQTTFAGFRCDVYKDLRDVMTPFNGRRHPAAPARASRTGFFLDALADYASEAWKSGAERSMTVAGYKVRIQCANHFFIQDLTRALDHLMPFSNSERADVTIHVWDASTRATDPHLATILEKLFNNWSESCGPRGELIGIHGEEVTAIYHPGPDILSVVRRESGHAYFLKRDQSPLPYWEIGSPFRYIFHSWFGARGLQFVHGGAVGAAAGGVLLTAPGGSGKSTTTMLCAKAGMQFAGDDYCLADPRTGYLHSLYNSSKLRGSEDLTRLPEMTGRSRNLDSFEKGGFGKGIYFLTDVWKDRLTPGFPLRAILIPSVTGFRESSLEPCSAVDALMAMMPSTVGQLPAASGSDVARTVALVEKLPAYRFRLGTDIEQIPRLVQDLLGQ